jgi:hypothetical protein
MLTRNSGLNNKLLLATDALDAESDLRDFIVATYDANTPMHYRLQPDDKPDLEKHLGLAAYDNAVSLLQVRRARASQR